MMSEGINFDHTTKYLQSLCGEQDAFLKELQVYAKKHRVPVIQLETVSFLKLLLHLHRPSSILEIGTAIGYSALVMAKEIPCKILSVERDEDMLVLARENIKKAGLQEEIKVLGGDALEILPCLKESYDMIFVDGAKGHYIDFLPDLIRLIRPGGLIVTDNVLYKGMIASDDLVRRRKITIVRRLREYLEAISRHPDLQTSVLPLGDGLSLSYKRKKIF